MYKTRSKKTGLGFKSQFARDGYHGDWEDAAHTRVRVKEMGMIRYGRDPWWVVEAGSGDVNHTGGDAAAGGLGLMVRAWGLCEPGAATQEKISARCSPSAFLNSVVGLCLVYCFFFGPSEFSGCCVLDDYYLSTTTVNIDDDVKVCRQVLKALPSE
ncbi:unnamed protein product [Sphenostylis stenocarpa]|uniref:Uncharacterized protein n=1 Tax=Sphenostylis stenocarpa TaxID=92480 RepID=A0AA86W2W5_9FABA|nr:unnamed protein product [Sphenostylis stenocarpa]